MQLTMQHLEILFETCAIQMLLDGEEQAVFNNEDCLCRIEMRIDGERINIELEWCDLHEQAILGAYMGNN